MGVETGEPQSVAITGGAAPLPPTMMTWCPKGSVVTPPPVPMGMRPVAVTYTSSVSTNISAYDDLPGHHLTSIRNLIAMTPDDSYPESAEESVPGQEGPEWDYSELQDREAFLLFQAAADYCLTCLDDSSKGDYDPTRECFVVNLEEHDDNDSADAANLAGANLADAQPQVQLADPPQGGDRRSQDLAQAAQLDELDAKIEEERRGAQTLGVMLEGDGAGRGTHAREAGHVARARIITDDNIDDPWL